MNILLFSKQINNNHTIHDAFIKKGFLLIELMVSITLFIFFIHLLNNYFAMTRDVSDDALKRYEVLTELESFITQAKDNPALLQKKSYEKNGTAIVWTQEPFPIQQTGFLKTLVSCCNLVTFKASWRGKDKKNNTITLVTGMVMS